MKTSIQKPIILGNYYHGGGEMAWAWWQQQHALVSIIGDRHLSPRKELIRSMTELITQRDPNSVFMITDDPTELGETANINAITWVEDYPDPPSFFEDRDVFINQRHFFSSSYFNLVAKSLDIPRAQLLPPIAFRPHTEGPLHGYERGIQGMDDSVLHKKRLADYLSDLDNVPWTLVEGQGRKYFIDTNASLYEQALSLLKAIWSFWAYTCQKEDPQQMLLVLEIPKELLQHGLDPVVEKVIFDALRILKYVCYVTTTTMILSSEMLYPAPELSFRYKLIFQTHESDLDWSNEHIKNMVDPALLREWEQGNKNVGLWMDDLAADIADSKILVRFGDIQPYLWEDYTTNLR